MHVFLAGVLLSLSGAVLAAPGPIRVGDYPNQIKVACVGDSITAGVGASGGQDYPSQLAGLLGDGFKVSNFGVSGATLLRKGDLSYWNQPAFKQAQDSAPDVVILMLGTNDTKPQNWKLKDSFAGDLKDMLAQFSGLASKPRIWLCLPPPVPDKGNYGISGPVLQNEEIPILKQVAIDTKTPLIDVNAALAPHPEMLPDNVHPNDAGCAILASTIFSTLTAAPVITPPGDLFDGKVTITISCPYPDWKTRYTTDGTTPEQTSLVYRNPMSVDYDVTIRAKAFGPDGAASPMTFMSYTKAVYRPAENPANTDPGLAYDYFEDPNMQPNENLDALKPVKSGVITTLDLKTRNQDTNFGFKFTGFITVPKDAIYTFYTSSDDGSTLSIGGKLIVDNGGMHGMQEAGGRIPLQKGAHAITITFYQGGGGFGLEARYSAQGLDKQLIPDAAWSHKK